MDEDEKGWLLMTDDDDDSEDEELRLTAIERCNALCACCGQTTVNRWELSLYKIV